MTERTYLLKCGLDTVGIVLLETSENWHNYGRLAPGPDYEHYREALEQFLAAEQACEALMDSDEPVSDAEFKLASDRTDRAERTLDQFGFYFEERHTAKVHPIHDFRPLESLSSVYWRWEESPADKNNESSP